MQRGGIIKPGGRSGLLNDYPGLGPCIIPKDRSGFSYDGKISIKTNFTTAEVKVIAQKIKERMERR